MTRATITDAIRPIRLITFVVVIAGLYLGRDILIPFALAVLLTFLLYPLVNRLRRKGLHRAVAVAIVITGSLGLLTGMGVVVVRQLIDLTARLPDYRENLRQKARDLRSTGSGKLARITGTLDELRKELGTTQPASAPVEGLLPVVPAPPPLKVEVVREDSEFGDIAAAVAEPLLIPLGGGAITLLLLIFFLLHSDDMRERLVTLAGMRQISLTTSAIDEAGTRIGQFLRMQALVNACYGLMLAIGLMCLGVPNAILWGVLGALLRFVPYLGAWIAAALPTILAIAVFPGWGRPIAVIALLAVVEFVTNMVLEPWLYGSSAGISSLGVVVAAVFWAWVWGPVGMILAVPITACLVVMGKYVPQLALLHQLFGCDAAVPAVGRLYQRLLVGDDDSAEEIIRKHGVDASFEETCDALLLPALSELKHDLARGLVQSGQVLRAVEIIDVLCDARVVPAPTAVSPDLLCIAGQNEVDGCAARLLARAAAGRGIASEVVSSHALASEAAERARATTAGCIALVQVAPVSTLHTKRLHRALQAKLENTTRVVVASFGVSTEAGRLPDARHENSVRKLVAQLKEQSDVKPTRSVPPATVPAVA